ncbi:polyprenol monophosphomannose synthase [Pontimicrobium aquaticum]|uniref:Polyprenol monophosphomannose synthase n=1 Tax=Pontimicrobium aquaticum TaxID=2565367 RepID=A0A4U0F568_9FLAO|nr:polyprenol monophosphomannose synthase [Pontimicrobium aquaticum]TJY37972.1 polyprenol monophosphomannose synthase [Pontimicrobium aquaticum]
MQDTIVIIPTFNEIENIEAIIRATFSLEKQFHILVVDDNSPDLTALKVKELQNEFKDKLFLEVRKEKSGLGTAYIHGFKWCLDKGYDYIFEMDADFSHNPNDLSRLYNACHVDGADMSIGSRYVKGVNVVNWPMSRVLLSYLASKYVRIITGMKIHDTTAGFVCYKRKVLESINLDKIKFVGYAFQIEMKFKTYLQKFKITEVPVIFTDRTKGESKLSGGIISEAIFGVISMKLKSLFRKR